MVTSPSLISSITETTQNRINLIQILAQYNTALTEFKNHTLKTYSAENPPPTFSELKSRWNQHQSPLHFDLKDKAKDLALNQTDFILTELATELSKLYELHKIDQTRQLWQNQLTQARFSGDTFSQRQWEELGKGVFFPENDLSHQTKISEQCQLVQTLQKTISTHPQKALKICQQAENILPQTIQNYFIAQAKSKTAENQLAFALNILANEQQGTPLRKDILNHAVQTQLISPEFAVLYKASPLTSLSTSDFSQLLKAYTQNKIQELIYTYIPSNDLHKSRKRTLFDFIACSPLTIDKKNKHLSQFNQIEKNDDWQNSYHYSFDWIQEVLLNLPFSGQGKSSFEQVWNNEMIKRKTFQTLTNYFHEQKEPCSQQQLKKELPNLLYKTLHSELKLTTSPLPNNNSHHSISSQLCQKLNFPQFSLLTEHHSPHCDPSKFRDYWEQTSNNNSISLSDSETSTKLLDWIKRNLPEE